MSDAGNRDYIAAVMSRLQAQQAALTGLTAAVESSMADLTAAIERPALEQHLAAIESGLADILAALEKGAAGTAIADAIRAMPPAMVNVPALPAPVVQVNVQPTPIQFEAVMPRVPAPVVHVIPPPPPPPAPPVTGKWVVRIPQPYGPDRVMTITREA